MISAIFPWIIREAIISVLTERAPLRRSLNRADAEKELRARSSRAVAAVPDHRDLLKFAVICCHRFHKSFHFFQIVTSVLCSDRGFAEKMCRGNCTL